MVDHDGQLDYDTVARKSRSEMGANVPPSGGSGRTRGTPFVETRGDGVGHMPPNHSRLSMRMLRRGHGLPTSEGDSAGSAGRTSGDASPFAPLLVSMRFLRGLDMSKCDHLSENSSIVKCMTEQCNCDCF